MDMLKNKKEKKVTKPVNLAETIVEQDKNLDGKQQEWMSEIIKQEVGKLFKAFQNNKEKKSNVNFIQTTTNFAGMASHSHLTVRNDDKWIIDTGASNYICVNSEFFDKLNPLTFTISVYLPNGNIAKVTHTGSIL